MSASIVSAVAETASTTATVSVIVNQVYALGLPCAVELETGLSTGAKAGIGVGAGVGGLIVICLITIIILMYRRNKNSQRRESAYHEALEKQMAASTNTGSSTAPFSTPYMMQSPVSPHIPLGSPMSTTYDPSHGSWQSQARTLVLPHHNMRPVEMQADGHQIHEIGEKERPVTPNAKMGIPREPDDEPAFHILVDEPHARH